MQTHPYSTRSRGYQVIWFFLLTVETVPAHMGHQNRSPRTNGVYHKSSDSSDVVDELFHLNFPFPYNAFCEPLWIPHMYILIYVH